jgi:hypothetical protein
MTNQMLDAYRRRSARFIDDGIYGAKLILLTMLSGGIFMEVIELEITEAYKLLELAKKNYQAELSRERRDPAMVDKVRFEMDVALKRYLDSTNKSDMPL